MQGRNVGVGVRYCEREENDLEHYSDWKCEKDYYGCWYDRVESEVANERDRNVYAYKEKEQADRVQRFFCTSENALHEQRISSSEVSSRELNASARFHGRGRVGTESSRRKNLTRCHGLVERDRASETCLADGATFATD